MHYQSVEQLLTDEGFLAAYFGTDEVQVARWSHWMRSSDENAALAREAYELLQSVVQVEEPKVSPEDIARSWARIQARMREEDQNTSTDRPGPKT